MKNFNIGFLIYLGYAPVIFLAAFIGFKIFMSMDALSCVIYSLLITGLISVIMCLVEVVKYVKLCCRSERQQKGNVNES